MLGCVAWTVWLILISVYPNTTINWIMKTESFNNGSFWLLIEPTVEIQCVNVFDFAFVLASYAWIFLKSALWRRQIAPSSRDTSRIGSAQQVLDLFKSSLQQFAGDIESNATRSSSAKWMAHLIRDAMQEVGQSRKYLVRRELQGEPWQSLSRVGRLTWICGYMQNVGAKLVDIVFQMALVVQGLENGHPRGLIRVLTSVVVANSVACALMICVDRLQSGQLQVLIDCL